MVFCCGILLVGCNKEKTKNNKKTEPKDKITNKVVVDGDKTTIDGAILKDMDIINLNNVFNLSVVFDNSNNDLVKLDMGKFTVKKDNKEMTVFTSDIAKIKANESYTQFGYPLKDTEEVESWR